MFEMSSLLRYKMVDGVRRFAFQPSWAVEDIFDNKEEKKNNTAYA